MANQTSTPIFDSDFLKQLEYLSLLSKRMFQGQLLAQRRTMQTGGGIEFSDHREYIHGDDLRYLDWNVYARHGDLLLKRFQEEEDLHVYILLDVSQSMLVEDPSEGDQKSIPKFTLARQIAAALSYIALADLDRVSIFAYADGMKVSMPLVRGKDQILSVLRFLESLHCHAEPTDLKRTVGEFVSRAPRTGLAIVVSDLFDQAGFREGVDRLRYAQFEPHVIQIHTAAEASPSLLGDVQLVDCETGTERKVTVTERKLRQYKQLFDAFVADIERYCRTHGLAHTRTTTDVPFDAVLLKMMRAAAVG
ncbi:DUF58 domain-containing protein [Roseiconus lacunae]|uniref:DUF58 domain-containing protein n=1 Tax=Roseiconus lacunae TaxID=2605694 RepID=A0ABT7PFS6_9BACT|nr:DUF58 domain-containing protein [Roseiconus lacunae]MCD0461446.1 DUF58 domain-containing protein [Roseiconus lacunae]MDM4015345.1 DUF58 domain-containing protein [Roseiconus lacunae]WRQ52977.1 DUF58 domain-containing protein [Stieleria sp. HD01]